MRFVYFLGEIQTYWVFEAVSPAHKTLSLSFLLGIIVARPIDLSNEPSRGSDCVKKPVATDEVRVRDED